MFHHLRDDEGATAVTVALVIVVLVLFAAIAVDVGYLYSVRRQLQTAADAAALAGCRVLADGGSVPEIQDEVDLYAANNAIQPGDGLYVLSTEIGDDYVQVAVEKDSPLFFARILGSSATLVNTVSRAQIAYLTGMSGIVPWGVPVINGANKVTVTLDGTEVDLEPQGSDLHWEKAISVPAADDDGYLMDVTVYNSQTEYPDGTSDYPDGVPEFIPWAASLYVRPAASPVLDVTLDSYVVTAGQDSTVELRVESATEPEARFNGKKVTMSAVTGVPGMWRAALAVPPSDDLMASFPVDITVGGHTVNSAVTLLVRRSTHPVLDVAVSDHVVGAGSVVTVSVDLHDYVYGQPYELRVSGGGGEIGNFCAIDLSTIRHTPNWMNPQHPAEYDVTTDPNYDPPTYYCYLENPFPFEVHLGDTIWTEPGAMSGPQSSNALEERFGDDDRTFAEWLASGDASSSRIVYVPVLEKMQLVTGTSPLRVISIAAFYVEPFSDIKKNEIYGVFLEYVAPSSAVSPTPPDGLNVRTVRLVPPQ